MRLALPSPPRRSAPYLRGRRFPGTGALGGRGRETRGVEVEDEHRGFASDGLQSHSSAAPAAAGSFNGDHDKRGTETPS